MELVEAPLQRDEPKPANSDSKPQRQATVELRFRGSLIVGDVVREFWQISQSAKKKVFSRLLVPKPGDFSSDGKNTSSGRFTYKDGWVEQDQTLSIQKSSAKTGQ
ncbi:MAG: hypothetical protein KDJ38_04435 [Gammaproteobacteria bacterium]|nr:hypothetical protein [Gammaproteobacteria bacterium]